MYVRILCDDISSVNLRFAWLFDLQAAWAPNLLAAEAELEAEVRGLGQVGIVEGSMLECALVMRGGMLGPASKKEKLIRCKAIVDGLRKLVDSDQQANLGLPQPAVGGGSETMESAGRVKKMLQGSDTKVRKGGELQQRVYLLCIYSPSCGSCLTPIIF